MKQDELIRYINKKVMIRMKNNWIYRGKAVNLNDETLTLIDVIKGRILLSIDDIASIL